MPVVPRRQLNGQEWRVDARSGTLRAVLALAGGPIVGEQSTSAAVQRLLDALAGDTPPEPIVRALLDRSVHRLQLLSGAVLHRSYPRLTRPPLNLKMLLSGVHARPAERERFLREAEAVAAPYHPNIVQVHDVGDVDGRPYFTMEFIEGGSLARKTHGVPQPAGEAAGVVATLAEAMHAAADGCATWKAVSSPSSRVRTGRPAPTASTRRNSVSSRGTSPRPHACMPRRWRPNHH